MFKLMGIAAVVAAGVALTGCASVETQRWAPDEAPVMVGPRVRANVTPLETAFPCLAEKITAQGKPRVTIAVGDVKDYTGKYSQAEGSTITQGGALMVYSALGKLGDAVIMAERFDTRIAELELAYMDRRQLGDGGQHALGTPTGGPGVVPWLPYYGGSIRQSDYYIIGGITELNYNIQSGGFQVEVNNVGAKRRTYTMNIGVDLRIVDTESMRVVKTISLQKQITGTEVGAGVFRFFGSDLFDINVGSKNQEPLQLGVRTILEQATLELVGAVTHTFAPMCVYEASYTPEQREAAALRVAREAACNCKLEDAGDEDKIAPPPPPPAGEAATATAKPLTGPVRSLPPQNGLGGGGTTKLQVPFDFGADGLSGQSTAAIEAIAAAASQGKPVDFEIIANDSESWAPQKRQDLTNARIRSIVNALAQRGIDQWRVETTWTPSASDTGITRDGAGFQIFAKLRVQAP